MKNFLTLLFAFFISINVFGQEHLRYGTHSVWIGNTKAKDLASWLARFCGPVQGNTILPATIYENKASQRGKEFYFNGTHFCAAGAIDECQVIVVQHKGFKKTTEVDVITLINSMDEMEKYVTKFADYYKCEPVVQEYGSSVFFTYNVPQGQVVLTLSATDGTLQISYIDYPFLMKK